MSPPLYVTFLVMTSLPVVRLLVNSAAPGVVALTVALTLLLPVSAMFTGRLLTSSTTVYSPGIRLLSVAVLLLPFSILISTVFS